MNRQVWLYELWIYKSTMFFNFCSWKLRGEGTRVTQQKLFTDYCIYMRSERDYFQFLRSCEGSLWETYDFSGMRLFNNVMLSCGLMVIILKLFRSLSFIIFYCNWFWPNNYSMGFISRSDSNPNEVNLNLMINEAKLIIIEVTTWPELNAN